MPALPLNGEHRETWQALLASVAEKTPGGTTMRSFPVRQLRNLLLFSILMIIAYGTLSALNLSLRSGYRGGTWGHCWDRELWDWYDKQLEARARTMKNHGQDRAD
jgi:hypothetical protein